MRGHLRAMRPRRCPPWDSPPDRIAGVRGALAGLQARAAHVPHVYSDIWVNRR